LWDAEYTNPIIPGSNRRSPSHALTFFEELLSLKGVRSALDVGCGNGRNSVYLASFGAAVEAIDFSRVALNSAKSLATERGLGGKIHFRFGNLNDGLPFDSDSFDLCLDMYVFCHFTDENSKQHHVNELFRVTKPGGHVISALFTPRDEYYSLMRTSNGVSNIVKDPTNGITKELYEEMTFRRWYSPPFEVRYSTELDFADKVLGKSYQRRILALALQKTKTQPA